MNATKAQAVLLLAAAAACVYVQTVFPWGRRLTGVQPDLLPLVMVYAALLGDAGLVACLAVTGGLMFDSLSMNPLGTSVLSLLVVGLGVHSLRDVLMREALHAKCLLGALASTASALTGLIALMMSEQRPVLGWDLARAVAGQGMWGAVLAPAVFWLLGRLDRAFNHPRISPGSFRPDREIKRGRN